MAKGPGVYDNLCTYAREQSHAVGAMVVIIQGDRGNGFSIQVPPEAAPMLPTLLRQVADRLEADVNEALGERPDVIQSSTWD